MMRAPCHDKNSGTKGYSYVCRKTPAVPPKKSLPPLPSKMKKRSLSAILKDVDDIPWDDSLSSCSDVASIHDFATNIQKIVIPESYNEEQTVFSQVKDKKQQKFIQDVWDYNHIGPKVVVDDGWLWPQDPLPGKWPHPKHMTLFTRARLAKNIAGKLPLKPNSLYPFIVPYTNLNKMRLFQENTVTGSPGSLQLGTPIFEGCGHMSLLAPGEDEKVWYAGTALTDGSGMFLFLLHIFSALFRYSTRRRGYL